ncbi:polysaccharide pyruvyl transferase family protein, partial [Faecalimonas sp.]
FKDEYIVHSKYVLDINKNWSPEQVDEYSYFVSGSDQVWNPIYPSTSSINFLQFAPKEKRIAVSPSFGINKIPKELQDEYAKWLESIPYLSVREEQGKKIIKELCGKKAKVLCDPTMALSKSKWTTIEKKPTFLENSKYILTYFLGDKNKEYDKFIKAIAQKEDLEIINLFDVTDLRVYATSPQEFLYLIHHASLVCTDSFHGAVFSIIMNSNFITFSRKETGNSMESRMHTLLSVFGLENRDYRKIDNSRIFDMDFSHTYAILESRREEMLDFLRTVMGERKMVKKNTDGETGHKSIFDSKEKCCGCSACTMVCPKQCITMEEDDEGFLYPQINYSLCIHCNKCQQVCPVRKKEIVKDDAVKCYAAYSTQKNTRMRSSSGGIFTELARQVFSISGVVYGAGFTENFEVEHQNAYSEMELSNLRGSKYVQSSMRNVYREIQEKLDKGIIVYFSGTPCQVKGLYSYLDKRYNNLITQDIICHGVPSPLVWKKYISEYSGLQEVSFRDKKFGWHYFSMYIKSKKETYRKRLDEDFYVRLFLDNTILRPICYDCPIKQNGSNADITLADCWESDKLCKEIKDTDKGLSLVLVHTEQGKKLWKEVVENHSVKSEELPTDKALMSQSALRKSAPCNPKRDMFFKQLEQVGFWQLKKFWYRDSVMRRLKKKEIYIKTKVLFWIKKMKWKEKK